jgi:hypothetical protein
MRIERGRVDHDNRKTYVYLRDLLESLTVPLRLRVGNPDERATFLRVLKADGGEDT